MRAFNRFPPAIVLAAICASLVATKAWPQTGYSTTGAVTTADQAIDRIISREHEELTVLRRYRPIVETYVQDMKPDVEMGIMPVSDHYFLSQADLSKGPTEDSMLDKKLKSKAERSRVEKSAPYVPRDFLKMVYIDADGFDRQHYEFRYVGREFLGEVRCVVFDIMPPDRKSKGRFSGRIWAEDQGFAIVRFNGLFETPSRTGNGSGLNLHFDSWRLNIQPDLWLPAFVYSQDSERQNSSDPGIRFKAQTRLWGYNLASLNRTPDFNQPAIDQSATLDHGDGLHDYSPVEAEREWQQRAESNVVDRLQRIGLLAPRGEVDKILETVINNLEVTNDLDIDVHCRVMLTGTLESFSIGHTIVMSRGLIDVLPDEASLATALAQELAGTQVAKPTTDQWGFNDMTNVTAGEALSRLSFKATPNEVDAANKKAFEWLKNSPYKDKLGNAALFLKQLSADSAVLPALIDPRLGNGVVLSSALANLGPTLQTDRLDQIAALPLGARVKVDPWDGRVELLKAKPVSLTSAREKMPFAVTPFLPFLTRYQESKAAGKADNGLTNKESANR